MYFASGAFDPLQWTSVVSFSRRWADKSPEPVMWFHYSVIILYSSSRPTLLSSARNHDKSNQQECSSLREKQHKQRVREKKKTFYFSCHFLLYLLLCGFSHYIYVVLSAYVQFLSSWFVVVVAASVLFLSFVFSSWALVKRSCFVCLDEYFNRVCATNNNC